MQIEAGKFYKTRDGRKVGPMAETCYSDGGNNPSWSWNECGDLVNFYTNDGKAFFRNIPTSSDIIAEWVDEPTSPIRTFTTVKREISSGEYDGIYVYYPLGGSLRINADKVYDAPALRRAAALFTEIADFLESEPHVRLP